MQKEISIEGVTIGLTAATGVPVQEVIEIIEPFADMFEQKPNTPPTPKSEETAKEGIHVLKVKENYEQQEFATTIQPRVCEIKKLTPNNLADTTKLKPHQDECLQWLIKSYRAGLPGVLLADDMGLGKTLQAIAFASLLKEGDIIESQPMLIVAPVGLLVNWQNEIKTHLQGPMLGGIVKLFGASLKNFKKPGISGHEAAIGSPVLDIEKIKRQSLVLTTYETLRDYQLSLGRIRFGLVIYDEMQKAKKTWWPNSPSAKNY